MFLNHYKSKQSSLRQQDIYFGLRPTAFLGATLLLKACVIYPHTVPINPPIEGSLVSVESGLPVSGAELTLNIGSDMSRTYRTSSDTRGRFAFAAHSDFRLITLLADAPACSTVLTIAAPGFKTRYCVWMAQHWCSAAALPPFEKLALIPEHMPNNYANLPAKAAWLCDDPAIGMNR